MRNVNGTLFNTLYYWLKFIENYKFWLGTILLRILGLTWMALYLLEITNLMFYSLYIFLGKDLLATVF